MREKQKKFCDEYLKDRNATQAAIRAGYSKKTAYSIGNENLKKPELKAYIKQQLEQIRSEDIADAAEVLEYLTDVMRNKENGARVRLRAAELLGKTYGIFTDKVDIEGAPQVVIVGADNIPE